MPVWRAPLRRLNFSSLGLIFQAKNVVEKFIWSFLIVILLVLTLSQCCKLFQNAPRTFTTVQAFPTKNVFKLRNFDVEVQLPAALFFTYHIFNATHDVKKRQILASQTNWTQTFQSKGLDFDNTVDSKSLLPENDWNSGLVFMFHLNKTSHGCFNLSDDFERKLQEFNVTSEELYDKLTQQTIKFYGLSVTAKYETLLKKLFVIDHVVPTLVRAQFSLFSKNSPEIDVAVLPPVLSSPTVHRTLQNLYRQHTWLRIKSGDWPGLDSGVMNATRKLNAKLTLHGVLKQVTNCSSEDDNACIRHYNEVLYNNSHCVFDLQQKLSSNCDKPLTPCMRPFCKLEKQYTMTEFESSSPHSIEQTRVHCKINFDDENAYIPLYQEQATNESTLDFLAKLGGVLNVWLGASVAAGLHVCVYIFKQGIYVWDRNTKTGRNARHLLLGGKRVERPPMDEESFWIAIEKIRKRDGPELADVLAFLHTDNYANKFN